MKALLLILAVIIGLAALLLLIAVIHTLLMPSKVSSYKPKEDESEAL